MAATLGGVEAADTSVPDRTYSWLAAVLVLVVSSAALVVAARVSKYVLKLEIPLFKSAFLNKKNLKRRFVNTKTNHQTVVRTITAAATIAAALAMYSMCSLRFSVPVALSSSAAIIVAAGGLHRNKRNSDVHAKPLFFNLRMKNRLSNLKKLLFYKVVQSDSSAPPIVIATPTVYRMHRWLIAILVALTAMAATIVAATVLPFHNLASTESLLSNFPTCISFVESKTIQTLNSSLALQEHLALSAPSLPSGVPFAMAAAVPVLARPGLVLGPVVPQPSIASVKSLTVAECKKLFNTAEINKGFGKMTQAFLKERKLGYISPEAKLLGQAEHMVTTEQVKNWREYLCHSARAAEASEQSPGGPPARMFEFDYVSDAKQTILREVDLTATHNLVPANAGNISDWPFNLIGVAWTGDGVSFAIGQSTDEMWQRIARYLHFLNGFMFDTILETVTPYWSEKIKASDAYALRDGDLALKVIYDLLIDKTPAYVNDLTDQMDANKNPGLQVVDAEDPATKLAKMEGLYRLLLSTSQGKSGSYGIEWYVSRVLCAFESNHFYNVLTTSTVERKTLDGVDNYTKVSIHILEHFRQNWRQWVKQGAKNGPAGAIAMVNTTTAASGKPVCTTCNKRGHSAESCRGQGGAMQAFCESCKMFGHSTAECTILRAGKKGKGGGNDRGGHNGKRKGAVAFSADSKFVPVAFAPCAAHACFPVHAHKPCAADCCYDCYDCYLENPNNTGHFSRETDKLGHREFEKLGQKFDKLGHAEK